MAAAIETIYPRALHRRCWVQMRNILEKVRRRDHEHVKADARRIYLADSRRQAQAAFQRFAKRRREYDEAMSSTRSFRGLIWNGGTALSQYLHKQLDITLAQKSFSKKLKKALTRPETWYMLAGNGFSAIRNFLVFGKTAINNGESAR